MEKGKKKFLMTIFKLRKNYYFISFKLIYFWLTATNGVGCWRFLGCDICAVDRDFICDFLRNLKISTLLHVPHLSITFGCIPEFDWSASRHSIYFKWNNKERKDQLIFSRLASLNLIMRSSHLRTKQTKLKTFHIFTHSKFNI